VDEPESGTRINIPTLRSRRAGANQDSRDDLEHSLVSTDLKKTRFGQGRDEGITETNPRRLQKKNTSCRQGSRTEIQRLADRTGLPRLRPNKLSQTNAVSPSGRCMRGETEEGAGEHNNATVLPPWIRQEHPRHNNGHHSRSYSASAHTIPRASSRTSPALDVLVSTRSR